MIAKQYMKNWWEVSLTNKEIRRIRLCFLLDKLFTFIVFLILSRYFISCNNSHTSNRKNINLQLLFLVKSFCMYFNSIKIKVNTMYFILQVMLLANLCNNKLLVFTYEFTVIYYMYKVFWSVQRYNCYNWCIRTFITKLISETPHYFYNSPLSSALHALQSYQDLLYSLWSSSIIN
jgi:hypothetical protein